VVVDSVVVVVGGSVVLVVVVGGSVVVVVDVDVVVVGGTVVVVVGVDVVVDVVVVDVEVVVVGGSVVVVVEVEVVVVGGSVVVVVGGAVVVVVDGAVVVDVETVVVDAQTSGGRHVGYALVVGPPVPTSVAEMPSVCGSVCGIAQVVAAGPRGMRFAVVVITARYVVTVAFAAGAVNEIVVSGVVRGPGFALGVESVTVESVFTAVTPAVNAPGFANVSVWPLDTIGPGSAAWGSTNDVVDGTAVIVWAAAVAPLLYPPGVLLTVDTRSPTWSLCGIETVYVISPPLVAAQTAFEIGSERP